MSSHRLLRIYSFPTFLRTLLATMNDLVQISSDLIACQRHCELRGFTKASEWTCGLMSSLTDQSALIMSQKTTDFSINSDFNDRAHRRSKNLFNLGQFKRAAFFLKDLKQTVQEHRCLYYHAQFMDIENDKLNLSAEGESVANTIRHVLPRINDVLTQLEKDLKKMKSDSWILCMNAKFLLKLNKVDQARSNLLSAIRQEPLNWPAWELLASLVVDKQHLKTLDIPNHWLRWFFLGIVLMKLQMFEEAFDLYQNIKTKFFPTSAYVISQIAVAQNELRDIEAAVDNFKLARSIDPFRLDDMDVYSNALYVSQRRYELASLAHVANEIEPYRYETCFCLANFYSLKAMHEKAATFFSRALKLDPTNVSAWILMGHEHMEMKKTEEAIKAYRSAINLDRTDPRAWYGLGQLYEILKMPNISLDNYLEAHKLKPYDSRITIALADTYEKLEWFDLALTYYKQAGGAGLSKLASLNEKLGRKDEALQTYIQYLDWLKQTEGYDPLDVGSGHSNPEIMHAEKYIKIMMN